MRTIQCQYCHGIIELTASVNGVTTCPHCGGANAVPKLETLPEAFAAILQGQISLAACKFEEAKVAFEHAIQFDDVEPSAYFGLALANFKVQFLRDEVNDCWQPICYEISDKVFTDDSNYRKALELATVDQKKVYRKQGQEIDDVRDEFYHLQASGLDYDCFLCVKVTDNGQLTQDSHTANDVYYHLKDKGYKPFYSEREIKGRTGAAYEALILYALVKSECMLIVCSNDNYLNTVWVKNEYTRFMKMVDNNEKERDAITFVFDGTPIEKLPNGKKIQGINLQSRDAYLLITDFVQKHTTPKVANVKYCLSCGTECAKEAKFCSACGGTEFCDTRDDYIRISTERKIRAEYEAKLAEEQRKAAEEEAKRQAEEERKKAEETKRLEEQRKEQERKVAQKAMFTYNKAKEFDDNGEFEQAFNLYLQAAELGSIEAQVGLAHCYYYGRATQKNPVKAAELYAAAAAIGNAEAQGFLGFCYEYGNGLPQDDAKAVEWLTKSAEQGYAPAQRNLGWYYENGRCVVQDYHKAIEWYTKAAKQGQVNAQYNLGMCYEYGRGVPKDLQKAKEWYTKAVDQHFTEAMEALIRVDKQISEQKAAVVPKTSSYPTLDNYNKDEFVIEGTKLWKYKGNSKKVQIPYGVEVLAFGLFMNRSEITNITIPDSVKEIHAGTFTDCSNLTQIVIPTSVNLFDCCFAGCNALETIRVEEGNTTYHSSENCLIHSESDMLLAGCKNSIIPTDGSVKKIGECAFSDLSNLTNIVIPDSVIDIDESAFENCENLTNVTIPKIFEEQINELFGEQCGKIKFTFTEKPKKAEEAPKAVTPPTDVPYPTLDNYDKSEFVIKGTVLKEYKGKGKEYVSKGVAVQIPDGVTTIGDYAFKGCRGISSLTIPKSVRNVDALAFDGCYIFSKLYYLGNIESWCSICFADYSSNPLFLTNFLFIDNQLITDLVVPGSVKEIRAYAFSNCKNLKSVTISGGVKSIGMCAFAGTNITSVTIFDGVEEIGSLAFNKCGKLKNITIPETVKKIGRGAFNNAQQLTNLTIPSGVREIGAVAFGYCYGIESLTIPDSVKKIGAGAFSDCVRLRTVTIPKRFAGALNNKLKDIFGYRFKSINFTFTK